MLRFRWVCNISTPMNYLAPLTEKHIHRKYAIISYMIVLVWVCLAGHLAHAKTKLPAPLPCFDQFYPKYDEKNIHKSFAPIPELKIVIKKRERKLIVYKNGKPWKTYRVALSQIPYGDKRKKGDKHTPEGKFFVTKKNPRSKYYLSLELSYPSLKHAEKGLRAGLITEKEYMAIVESIEQGKSPPQNTKLGGYICIHGGGNGKNWTDGCIALKNKDITELYKIVRIGTPVIILPR